MYFYYPEAQKLHKYESHLAKTYKKFPIEIASGKGSLVYDAGGKMYIDLGSQTGVNIFGVSDNLWISAVAEQAGKIPHISNSYISAPQISLAALLCERSGAERVFFSNSGAEANECAVKAARKYSAQKYTGERHTVITLQGSFHGRTISMLSATGQAGFHIDFTPLTPGFEYVDPDRPDELLRLCETGKVCAIMLECVRGEGGVLPLPESFAQAVKKVTKENDILLICDEIQCGLGRCGRLFAYENYGLAPDIVTLAKGLGGGLPLGATLFFGKTADVLGEGDHGSTFGGNACACAGAETVIRRLTDDVFSEVRRKSALVFSALGGAKGIKKVRGEGLMIGIETERPSYEIAKKCAERGVLLTLAKGCLRLLPALNIPGNLLLRGIEIIKSVAEESVSK